MSHRQQWRSALADALYIYEQRERTVSILAVEGLCIQIRQWYAEHPEAPLPPGLRIVLGYMGDIEGAVETTYFPSLISSISGRQIHLATFMRAWAREEAGHADALYRARCAIDGVVPSPNSTTPLPIVPAGYQVSQRVISVLSYVCGTSFMALQMAWGAINELSTVQAYLRVADLVNCPPLATLLRLIAREEVNHAEFYVAAAKALLEDRPRRQRFVRFALERLWTLVGIGVRTEEEAGFVARLLYGGYKDPEYRAMSTFHRYVTERIASLPGLSGFNRSSELLGAVAAGRQFT